MDANTRYNTNLARLLPKQIYSPCIVDWNVLNTLGYVEAIEGMLEIKVYKTGGQEEIFTSEAWRRVFHIKEPIYMELCHKFDSIYEFDEVVTVEELIMKKLIKFRLGGLGHLLTLLEFSRRLGLYNSQEIREEGFKEITTQTIRRPILKVLQEMITYGLCQRTTGYYKIQRNKLWLMSMFEARQQNGSLDATTLRELVGSNGRLIVVEPALGVPRVAMLRPLYAGVFEYMVGQYNIPLYRSSAPPSYDEEPQQEGYFQGDTS
ncbi:hypothetical protein Tco_1484891 [Tanacetum coccineum]